MFLAMAWIGCEVAWCPIDPFDEATSCSTEHEACGREASCATGLECVSTMLCTVGPCPGTCLAACEGSGDCGADEICAEPDGWDQRYCLAPEGPSLLPYEAPL
jgi:hypothetical protein